MEHDPCSVTPPLSESGIACPICGSATVVQKNRQSRHRRRGPLHALIDHLVYHHHGCPICGISFKVSVSELLRKKMFAKTEEQVRIRALPLVDEYDAYVPRAIADTRMLVARTTHRVVDTAPPAKPTLRLEVHQPFLGIDLQLTLGGSRIPESVRSAVAGVCQTTKEACQALLELMKGEPEQQCARPRELAQSTPSVEMERDSPSQCIDGTFLDDTPSLQPANRPEGFEN